MIFDDENLEDFWPAFDEGLLKEIEIVSRFEHLEFVRILLFPAI